MLHLAWRNVWRNRRRSLLTVSSIACGLAAILFAESMIKTVQRQLIEKATGVITGHIQIQESGVKNYKFPERTFDGLPAVERVLSAMPQVAGFEARILLTGLVSTKSDSNGVLICAIEPARDERVTTQKSYMVDGAYLTGRGGEIVMGDALARMLGLSIGRKAVIMAQAADGSMGADNFRLVGIYHTGSQSFDKQIVYVPLRSLQEMLGMEGRANNVVVRLNSAEDIFDVRRALAAALSGKALQVLTWREVDAELVGVQVYQNAILAIVLGIVFVIVALGILNTLLMSMFERVREFGILMAIGARPRVILGMVVLESFLMGMIGAALGLAVGAGLISYYGVQGLRLPIGDTLGYFLPFPSVLHLRFDWQTHQQALVAVVVTSLLAALPPALRASRLKPAESIRNR